jgi:GNAT superfamily N-acetyltransferase
VDDSWLVGGCEKGEETFLFSMISHLADVPFFLDELAGLHVAEWGHLYSGWGVEAVRAEFLGQRADGSLPATLVLHEGMELVGSVSVIFGDCPARPDLDPWLASLYVVSERRGRGHGLELIRAAIELAAGAGEKRLHVYTESAECLFERFGFEMLDRTLQQAVPISVLARTLP